MSWRSKYPDWYESECNFLSTSNIYTEKRRLFNKLFVSTGELLIRSKQFIRQPILIIYPTTTPFKVPEIYVLKEVITEKELELISNRISVKQILLAKKKLLYLRHQMADGKICFLEEDNLHNDAPQLYTILDILERVRKWISSISTGKIPFDNLEVEFFSHYPYQTDQLNILLPEIFYDQSIVSGEFYLVNYKTITESLTNKKTYVGIQIAGQNTSNISLLPKSDEMFGKIIGKIIPGLFDLLKTTEKTKELMDQELIISGSWWHINNEPHPFENKIDFLKFIAFDYEDSIRIFMESKTYSQMLNYAEKVYFGLRFTNRRGGLEWIMFLMKKTDTKPFGLPATKEDLPIILGNYSIEVIKTDKYTDEKHHLRNSSRAKRILLKEKDIVLIGCGALGSEIADCLGKAGIGTITLIDNQMIVPHNPVRHLCGLRNLYFPKSIAVALEILEHNPFVQVKEYINDFSELNINEFILENSIGVSSLADDNLESYLNETAISNNKVMFYTRVLRGGKVARIFRIIPGIDACFGCLVLYKKEKSGNFLDIPEDTNFPTILNECNNPIRPASASDIKMIASITARIILEFLQGESTDYNHWIVSTESIKSFTLKNDELVKANKLFIPQHPNCSICNNRKKLKVRILENVIELMKCEIAKDLTIETGGILIGFKGKNDTVYICQATEPGPHAIRSANWFERDVEFCQNILNEEFKEFHDKGIYIGEWHYHPSKSTQPSNRDLLSLSEIAAAENYLVDDPIMIIFDNNFEHSCTVHPVGKKYYFTNLEIINKERDEL